MMWMLLALAAATEPVDCPHAVDAESMLAKLEQAETAYADLEVALFAANVNGATLDVPCMSEAATPEVAARLHRLLGLRSYADNPDASMESLAAARVLDPSYRFPDAMLPEGHALRNAFEALPVEGPTTRVPEPRHATLLMDGIASRGRPVGRATWVQLRAMDGTIAASNYIFPEQPLPTYRAIPRTRNSLIAATAGAAVASASLYGLAWATRATFDDTASGATRQDVERQRSTINGLLIASGALAAAGAGGMVGIMVVGQR
jgi:hypothetical protein